MTSFTVIDMTCGACASRISQALKQANLPPELGIDIDTESREVRLVKGASRMPPNSFEMPSKQKVTHQG